MRRYRQPDKKPATPEEIADVKKKLEDAGLNEDVGEDEGAAALRKEMLEELGIDPNEMDDRIRLYWLTHEPSSHGEHKKALQNIAANLGLTEYDVDEDYARQLQTELSIAEREAGNLVRLNRPPRLIERSLKDQFPLYSEEVIGLLLVKAMQRETRRAA
jgi:8-oxo-dGTP pyrophosphatase MutT (NUDIX family)